MPPGWGQQPAAPVGWNQPPPPGPWGAPTTTPQTNGLAIASLVLGIAGIAMCLGPFGSVPALITGYKGRNEIDQGGGVQGGRSMAVAGIILGWVGLGLLALGIVIVVLAAIFGNSSSDTTSSMLRFSREVWNLRPPGAA